jgi:phosphopentomutase
MFETTGVAKRVTMIVLDSLGIGALPDAAEYGDAGANTLAHILDALPGIQIPNLRALGLCNIEGAGNFAGEAAASLAVPSPLGAFGRLGEISKGKDTITGHWEIAGVLTETPFQTFLRFPDAFMEEFEAAIGIGTLGNYPASGTVIIDELGPEHERTGKPIVYTSSDSVFQIAANTDVIPLKRLYEICEIARAMLQGPMLVGRVIARPYVMEGEKRVRTSDRHDYAVAPPEKTLLDQLKDGGMEVVSIGKIKDIFAGQGVTRALHTNDNDDGVRKTIQIMKEEFSGLIFTNLVDFDAKFGHRRDTAGYGKAIEEFDAVLPEIMAAMREDEMLMLTADHGNDPAHSGTDHTREYVPLMVYGNKVMENCNLGTRDCFGDISATILAALGRPAAGAGRSFLSEII